MEKALRRNLEAIGQETERSIVLMDKGAANTLSALYSMEEVWQRFAPLIFQTFPIHATPAIHLQTSSRVVILLSSFLWDTWDLIRRAIHDFVYPPVAPGAPHPSLTITVYCGASDFAHEGLRPGFSPTNRTTYE